MDINDIMNCFTAFGILFLIAGTLSYIHQPFVFPYFRHTFDISGRRKPNEEDLIDEYLIDNGFKHIITHQHKIEAWEKECERKIAHSPFKARRMRQYREAADWESEYIFTLERLQTRYKQVNYIKTPYKVRITEGTFSCDYEYLMNRYVRLKMINFECTLRKYNSDKQRQLCTRKLREDVMKRDNYTCQICGKYMPDEVGLHIDHIIPISKGGKSVMSNLQVTCSKCNGHKSNK